MIFKGAGFDSSSLRPVSPSNRSILQTTIQPLNPTIKNQLEDTSGDYVYDAAGNLTQPGPIGGPYVYDAENHLTSADGVTYTYDGDGNRVMKSNGTIYWYGANSASLEESDLSGNLQRWYYFFNGQRVGRRLTTNEVGFYMTDALGSVRYLGGSATGYRFDYFPFGAPILDSDTGDDRYQFTGKERDSESGLDNFGARFDSSSIGRFMSPDWSDSPEPVPFAKLHDPQSLNLYVYVGNDPLNATDSDGHDQICLDWACSHWTGDPQQSQNARNAQQQAQNTCQADTCVTVTAQAPKKSLLGRIGGWFGGAALGIVRWGKLGGPLHRAGIERIARLLEENGFKVQREVRILTPNGAKSSRWVDVVGTRNGEVRMYQIGRQNLDGTPVAREVEAADDIEGAAGLRPNFLPYNIGAPNFGVPPVTDIAPGQGIMPGEGEVPIEPEIIPE